MGMFDRVHLPCPKCGTWNEFQSKGGNCILHDYTPSEDIPVEVLLDIKDDITYCSQCNTPYGVKLGIKVDVDTVVKKPKFYN